MKRLTDSRGNEIERRVDELFKHVAMILERQEALMARIEQIERRYTAEDDYRADMIEREP